MRAFLTPGGWLMLETGQILSVDTSILETIELHLKQAQVKAKDFVYMEMDQVSRILRVYSTKGDQCPILHFTSQTGEYSITQVGTVVGLVKSPLIS